MYVDIDMKYIKYSRKLIWHKIMFKLWILHSTVQDTFVLPMEYIFGFLIYNVILPNMRLYCFIFFLARQMFQWTM